MASSSVIGLATGVATGLATSIATPWLEMSRRGTLDQQTVAAWRATSWTPHPPAEVAIPAPRAAVDDASALHAHG